MHERTILHKSRNKPDPYRLKAEMLPKVVVSDLAKAGHFSLTVNNPASASVRALFFFFFLR